MQDYTANSFFFDMFALFWFSSFFFTLLKDIGHNPPPPHQKQNQKPKPQHLRDFTYFVRHTGKSAHFVYLEKLNVS